jgi:hypothetical protein
VIRAADVPFSVVMVVSLMAALFNAETRVSISGTIVRSRVEYRRCPRSLADPGHHGEGPPAAADAGGHLIADAPLLGLGYSGLATRAWLLGLAEYGFLSPG